MMILRIRLYEELNRVLDPGEKKRPFWKRFQSGASLGQLIASIGLDQSEVDLALINSKLAGFWQVLRDGDRISLYPEFESFDIRDLALQESGPLRRTRLVAAPELSLLGGRLQQMGFDCKLIQDLSLDELIEIGKQEKRILRNSQARRCI